MNFLFALLLSVSPADRADWPPAWESSRQHDTCQESITNLKMMRAARGYEDGRWDEWIKQTEENRDAWGILAVMDTESSDLAMCRGLLAYKKLVGPLRYLRRYRPPFSSDPYPYPILPPLVPPPKTLLRPQWPNKVR